MNFFAGRVQMLEPAIVSEFTFANLLEKFQTLAIAGGGEGGTAAKAAEFCVAGSV